MTDFKPLHVCPARHSFILDFTLRRLVQNPVKNLGEYVHAGDRVLDIGCGPGFFTLPLLRMVGDNGHVTAVDMQARMLAKLHAKAAKANMLDRLTLHQCNAYQIGLTAQADFILAMYMVHETPSPYELFKEIAALLSASGRFLLVEPSWHVSKSRFGDELTQLERAGLQIIDFPKGKGGHCVLAARSRPA